ncbi:MAG: amidase family protein, partial [Nocardioidaceae bacterium]
MAEAAAKDDLLREGVYEGWMHGFPHAVKDLADVEGLPTSYGLLQPSWGLPVPTSDSLFVSRLRAAGAIFIGKTNTPELGLGSQTYNNVFGTTRNAYDPTKTSGGSSGGAAVAVALRMVPVADGSDFMGSLRNPPGWNNVLGLRPCFGRVPAGGEQFLDQGGVNGPIARSALDLGLLLRTMAGYSDKAPLSIGQDLGSLARLTDSTVEGRQVAWLGDIGGYLPMESEVKAITSSAVTSLERLGMSVTAFDTVPGFDLSR